MRRVIEMLTAALFILLIPTSMDAAEESPQLEGVYSWKGVNGDGSETRGRVHIVRHGDTFLVAWMLPEDDLLPIAVGVGVADGGMFAVLFYGPLTEGVVLYRIEDGGRRLVGRWVSAGGDGTTHPDVLTRIPDEEPAVSPRVWHAPR